jgi:hypothetical protein
VVPVLSSANLTRGNFTSALKSIMSKSSTALSGQPANRLLTTPTLALLGGPLANLDDEELTQENVSMQSLTKLKEYCKKLGLDYSRCREKSDLVDLLKPHIPSADCTVDSSVGEYAAAIPSSGPEDEYGWEAFCYSSDHRRLTGCFEVDMSLLAPEFDYDFTTLDLAAEGTHQRGGELYHRPIGWKKFGLDVKSFSTLDRCTVAVLIRLLQSKGIDVDKSFPVGTDKSELVQRARREGFTDEMEGARWLGSSGTDPLEWCVAYHGTSAAVAKHIAREGLRAGGGSDPNVEVKNGAVFGRGVYCTPNVFTAEQYAEEVKVETDSEPIFFQIIFQCRVHGPGRSSYEEAVSDGGFFKVGLQDPSSYAKDYWIVPKEADVRPYAILMRQIENQ